MQTKSGWFSPGRAPGPADRRIWCRPGAAQGNLWKWIAEQAASHSRAAKMIQLKVKRIWTEKCNSVYWHSPQTMLNCIDNSGAAVVECVNVLKKKRPATVGTCQGSLSTGYQPFPNHMISLQVIASSLLSRSNGISVPTARATVVSQTRSVEETSDTPSSSAQRRRSKDQMEA